MSSQTKGAILWQRRCENGLVTMGPADITIYHNTLKQQAENDVSESSTAVGVEITCEVRGYDTEATDPMVFFKIKKKSR